MVKKWEIGLTVGLAAAVAAASFLILTPLDRRATQLREFVVATGDSSALVARRLAEQGLVRNRFLFIGYTILIGKERDFQAGTYSLSPALNIPKIVELLASGQALPEAELITIPEGMNSGEIVKLLTEKGFKGLKVSEFVKNEGYLFPDSYYFTDTTEIIPKMRENFAGQLKLLPIPASKLADTIIVASLLEKEVPHLADQRLVAGIIKQRLALGMPLQIDATVAYGVCLPKWQANASLNIQTFKYLNICDVTQVNLVDNIPRDGEYNTYQRIGLPPTPISNPGLAAIRAAFQPQASEYLYYLSAKDGTTIFAKTAAEHAANRRKYLGK